MQLTDRPHLYYRSRKNYFFSIFLAPIWDSLDCQHLRRENVFLIKYNTVKRFITCLLLVMAVGSFTAVRAQQDPSARAAAMKQKMKDDLKLTDVQADSISAIHADMRPKMREIYQDQSLSDDDKKAKFKALNDQANTRIKAVLGDDLFKKYQDWWQKNRPQRMGGGGGGNQ